MASQRRPDPQTDHKRLIQRDGKPLHILDGKHDVVGAVSGHAVGDLVKIPQIALCRAQLYDHNIRVRRCPRKRRALLQTAARRNACHRRPVPVFIPLRHDGMGIFRQKRFVDLFTDIF